jgi:hypothetical protein
MRTASAAAEIAVTAGNRLSHRRSRLAYEAARILSDQGDQTFDRARRKAAERTGNSDRRDWPTNEEIQDALIEQRRLFASDRVNCDLRRLREQAMLAMDAFSKFRPRLVGGALIGSGNLHQGVRMHLFAERPEEVVFALLEQGIPWQEREVILRYGGSTRRTHPMFAFVAGDIPFALVVLPLEALRNPPLDLVTERPDRGVDGETLRQMLQSSAREKN